MLLHTPFPISPTKTIISTINVRSDSKFFWIIKDTKVVPQHERVKSTAKIYIFFRKQIKGIKKKEI